MNKKIRFSFSILACLAVISCSIPNNTNNVDSNNKVSHSSNNAVIKGKTEFPELISDGFSTKATIAQVGAKATVSLIYPPDDATSPNVTIATGLTDASGMFTIDPVFSPVTNKVYILEATKRIGSSGNDVISVRTYIRNNGSGWESITTPGININATTTAITIIDSYDNTISSNDTINTVNNGTPSNIGGVTTGVISNLVNIVNNVITNDRDPVRFISYQNNKYFILRENPYNKDYLITNKACPNCDLSGENISNQDLTGADLTNTILSNVNFTGTNLTNVNLSGRNLSNSDLTNANLTNANLTNSNLTKVNMSGVNKTNTNFTGATWLNGTSTCLSGSIGFCLLPDNLVNTNIVSNQQNPDIAMDVNGNYVITWQSNIQDGSNYGVYAQRYNSAGVAQGSEFRVNTYFNNRQYNPKVAMDVNGNFVITWESFGQDGSGYGIYAQRYNNAGIAQGSEFRVNTFTTGAQTSPSIGMDASGNFAISWTSDSQSGNSEEIYVQRYNSAGVSQGSEFRANTYSNSSQTSSAIAMDSTGNFVVAWQSYGQEGFFGGYGIFAQRYNSAGVAQGAEFNVNTYTTNPQRTPNVAIDNSGNFIVAWQSYGQNSDKNDIYAQRYSSDATLTPIGTEFRVNTYTTNNQDFSDIAIDASGNFIVTWKSSVITGVSQDGNLDGVYAQRFSSDATLTPIGSEFKVNTYTTNAQKFSRVATDSKGNFTITWQSTGQDGNGDGIYLQNFDSSGNAR